MKLLPLFIFWCLWFLSFFTRGVFSPFLPMIVTALMLQATLSLAFFPIDLSTLSKLTPLSERAMATGVIADYLNFEVGILGIGILTSFSSQEKS